MSEDVDGAAAGAPFEVSWSRRTTRKPACTLKAAGAKVVRETAPADSTFAPKSNWCSSSLPIVSAVDWLVVGLSYSVVRGQT